MTPDHENQSSSRHERDRSDHAASTPGGSNSREDRTTARNASAKHAPMGAQTRLVAALCSGAVAAIAASLTINLSLALLTSFAVTHLVFVGLGWFVLWPLDGEATEGNAHHEDLGSRTEEALVVAISLGALLGIATLLGTRGSQYREAAAALALLGVFTAWGSLHLMYATRYGYLYYVHNPGAGIDFNMKQKPTYRDFIYFSYTLGMTYAVSDTNVSDEKIRSVVVRHTMLSYVFGVVILASTINVVAGIVTR